MQIPKRFKLLGHTIEVKDNPALMRERNWSGAADYELCQIELLPVTETTPRSVTKFEQTFCHEFAHFLLYYAGAAVNHQLNGQMIHQNEEFVDLLASALHQALTTMEYE